MKPDLPDRYILGDRLDWHAPWINVTLWVELPFWLMVHNITASTDFEGHEFAVSIQSNYWELFIIDVTDSRRTAVYRGPRKERNELSPELRQLLEDHPDWPCSWRKCKTVLKIASRCNADVWKAALESETPRKNEALLYLSELCRGHIPVVNKLIKAYRIATYDYFAFEVSPWDVSHWAAEDNGETIQVSLVGYRDWDQKPLLFENAKDEPSVYNLIEGDTLQSRMSDTPTPGELELLDALNLMERGDYSGAVRRITTAIEVIVETVTEQAMEARKGQQAAEKFIRATRMRFNERIRAYQKLTGREMSQWSLKSLNEIRDLRHQIVHAGFRIGPHERGRAQKAVDTGRWIFNWFENNDSKSDIRERRIGLRSLGRDLTAGIFNPKIAPDGIVLSQPH
jgi:hypothetical protein